MPLYACIGWGSLLWDPRSLPMASRFRADGPRLPIEFSRVAMDGRVTLVIDAEAEEMATWWCPLAVTSMAGAIEALGRRERIVADRWPDWIGWQARCARRDGPSLTGEEGADEGGVEGGSASAATRATIAQWLGQQGIDGVVWTALPPRTPEGEMAWPTTEELLAHLQQLEGRARARAEEYVRRAPPTIRSARRRRFEAELGWTPSEEAPNAPTPGREAPPH